MSVLQDNIQSVTDLINGCVQAIDTASNQIKETKAALKVLDKISDLLGTITLPAGTIEISPTAIELMNLDVQTAEQEIAANKTQMKKLQKALATLQEIEVQ